MCLSSMIEFKKKILIERVKIQSNLSQPLHTNMHLKKMSPGHKETTVLRSPESLKYGPQLGQHLCDTLMLTN